LKAVLKFVKGLQRPR